MLNDETIYKAIDKREGETLSIWEIAVAAGVSPSEMSDFKERLRQLAHQGILERKGKGYRRAPTPPPEADGAGAEILPKQSRARQAAKRAPWEGTKTETIPTKPKARPDQARQDKAQRRERPQHRERRGRREASVIGVVRSKQEGYGFLHRLDGEGEDLFLPPHEAQRVMDGDRVRVRIVPGRYGRDVAQVVEVLEHRRRQFLGVYHSRRRSAWIEPLDPLLPPRVSVPQDRDVRDGQVVKVAIVQYDEEGGLLGEILEVAGERDDPRIEVMEIAYSKGFSDLFPPEVSKEAAAIPDRVLARDRKGRKDLTAMPLVTIDGPDAKDFDDAIFVERRKGRGGGFRLVVAIADVAHYVSQGSALDEEAFLRGTSLYLPTDVLPMLPENISNGICSLQPGVERLCLVADITFDRGGEPKGAAFYEAVMASHARCTYGQVAALIDGEEVPELGDVAEHLLSAAALAQKLREKRVARGALDFDIPEARVTMDEDARPIGVSVQERNEAHRLIEEFMLAANEAVARHFDSLRLPGIYRVHDVPDPEKLEAFARLGQAVGMNIDLEAEELTPLKLSALLRQIEGSPQQKALNMLLLRAMMQAVYTSENIGHYGLAAKHYLHFTAPIRRYPDLTVHRLLKEHWAQGGRVPTPKQAEFIEEELEAVAAHSSEQERAAMDAEREADRFLKCLFMQDHVGDRFDATVVGVADFGIFAEIDRFLIEGLIRGEEIGVDFRFDEDRQRLVFPSSGRSFGVGEKVRVEVAGVDVPRRQIHMALVADEEGRVLPSRGQERAARMVATAWPGAQKGGKKGAKAKSGQGAGGKKSAKGVKEPEPRQPFKRTKPAAKGAQAAEAQAPKDSRAAKEQQGTPAFQRIKPAQLSKPAAKEAQAEKDPQAPAPRGSKAAKGSQAGNSGSAKEGQSSAQGGKGQAAKNKGQAAKNAQAQTRSRRGGKAQPSAKAAKKG